MCGFENCDRIASRSFLDHQPNRQPNPARTSNANKFIRVFRWNGLKKRCLRKQSLSESLFDLSACLPDCPTACLFVKIVLENNVRHLKFNQRPFHSFLVWNYRKAERKRKEGEGGEEKTSGMCNGVKSRCHEMLSTLSFVVKLVIGRRSKRLLKDIRW